MCYFIVDIFKIVSSTSNISEDKCRKLSDAFTHHDLGKLDSTYQI